MAADARADLFGLGAVLYECVVGCDAFDGDPDSDWNRYRTWAGGPPDHPRLATLPSAVRDVLTQTLAGDRERRIASAGQLRDELRRILRTEYRSDGDEELRLAVGRFRSMTQAEEDHASG
jgi:serine/threonine protein kinase